MEFITAVNDTYTKQSVADSSTLADDQKEFVEAGTKRGIEEYEEADNGHFKVTLAAGSGVRYVYGPHWEFPHNIDGQTTPTKDFKYPTYDEVNWSDFSQKVGKRFTVGEVSLHSQERIVRSRSVGEKVLSVAKLLDQIQEEYIEHVGHDVSFRVTSWYRPWPVNRRIGSRAPNHPNGGGVDFFPVGQSIHKFQDWFKRTWYDTGRWKHGFGLGARKGFIHIDQEHRRSWPY